MPLWSPLNLNYHCCRLLRFGLVLGQLSLVNDSIHRFWMCCLPLVWSEDWRMVFSQFLSVILVSIFPKILPSLDRVIFRNISFDLNALRNLSICVMDLAGLPFTIEAAFGTMLSIKADGDTTTGNWFLFHFYL